MSMFEKPNVTTDVKNTWPNACVSKTDLKPASSSQSAFHTQNVAVKSVAFRLILIHGKVHPCTGTEALYRPYGP